MTDDPDAEAEATAASEAEAAEWRRYEEEREARRVRRDALSRRVTGWIVAAALAFLAYDSGGTAVRRHSDDRAWMGHAALSFGCLVVVLSLLFWLLRRRRR